MESVSIKNTFLPRFASFSLLVLVQALLRGNSSDHDEKISWIFNGFDCPGCVRRRGMSDSHVIARAKSTKEVRVSTLDPSEVLRKAAR